MKQLQKKTGIRSRRVPVIPLKDFVMFPNSLYPLLVGRDQSILAAEYAFERGKELFLVMQKDPELDDVQETDLYRVGTTVKILHYLKMPNGLIKILVEGVRRDEVNRFIRGKGFIQAMVKPFKEDLTLNEQSEKWVQHLKVVFHKIVDEQKDIPEELFFHLEALRDASQIIDFICLHLQVDSARKQDVLSTPKLSERLEKAVILANEALATMEIERDIENKVKDNMMEHQRQMILQEQMKVIKEELGQDDDDPDDDLFLRIEQAGMPREAHGKVMREYRRLQMMPGYSPEAGVIQNYIDWMVSLPWKKKTRDRIDFRRVRKVLDADHYGLKKVKERILEHLAVLKLSGQKSKGSILCLVGPPGVGKTSLASSVARALNRKFVRVSLGGVRDEAEIRGHRRTYVGAMPGRIIQGMKKAGVKNPVFLMDEIDKMSMDFRGDPSAALLEVLDPAQNKTFNDHYVETDFDLSQVFFITTANSLNQIPWALKDRMEIIEIPGYLDSEKKAIAEQYLFPRQLKEAGFKKKDIVLNDSTLEKLIDWYTREAGVRNLERTLGELIRKIAVKVLEDKTAVPLTVSTDQLESWLGAPKFKEAKSRLWERPGLVTGLAWTAVGGDIIKIEVIHLKGKGKIHLTGKLGEVMKESAEIAMTYVKSILYEFGVEAEFFKDKDIHIHLPEGAVPKDGPSAGITLAAAILSAVMEKSVPKELAMTGELTLHGAVLPVGGISEKLMAAKRNAISRVLLPAENKSDFDEVAEEVKNGLSVEFVEDCLLHVLKPLFT